MEEKSVTYKKTFGVTKSSKGYRVILDVEPSPRGPGFVCSYTDLVYKRKETALFKAERFARSLYKPFTDMKGRRVTFIFENVGEV